MILRTSLLARVLLLVAVGGSAECPAMSANVHRKSLMSWSGEDVASVIGARLPGKDAADLCSNILTKDVTGYEVALHNDWTFWTKIAPDATDPHPKRVARWFRTRFGHSMLRGSNNFPTTNSRAPIPIQHTMTASIPFEKKKKDVSLPLEKSKEELPTDINEKEEGPEKTKNEESPEKAKKEESPEKKKKKETPSPEIEKKEKSHEKKENEKSHEKTKKKGSLPDDVSEKEKSHEKTKKEKSSSHHTEKKEKIPEKTKKPKTPPLKVNEKEDSLPETKEKAPPSVHVPEEKKKKTTVDVSTKKKKKNKKAWISKRLVDRKEMAYLVREEKLFVCTAMPSLCDMPTGRFKLCLASCVVMSKNTTLVQWLVLLSVVTLCWRRRNETKARQRQGLAMRIFVAALMIVETWSLAAPELNAFATPELISLNPRFPSDDGVVPPLVQWILPSLSPVTRLYYFRRLKFVRFVCVVSWSAFVASREDWFYVPGALAYTLLNTIGLAYNKGHSTQGVMLFVLSACLSVGDFDDPWLHRFLMVQVLIPVYLFSGISKIRYLGLTDNFLTGNWLKEAMMWSRTKKTVPTLFWIATALPRFMSISNQYIETVQPLLVLFFGGNRALMLAAAALFHISILILLGPNFIKLVLLLVLAADPLASFSTTASAEKRETPPPRHHTTLRRRVQAVYGALVVFGWLRVQLITDYLHLAGYLKDNERHNPYFPFPELSMFAMPHHRDQQNYAVAACMDVLIAIGYTFKEFNYWRSLS